MPGVTSGELRPELATVAVSANAHWRNVPAAVWGYKLRGYQVLKKWLSYREQRVLNRPLTPAEAQHFADAARSVAALLLAAEIPG